MKQFASDFADFAERLVAKAWPQLGGSAVFLLTWALGEPKGWSSFLILAGFVILFVWAGFLTWREERVKYQSTSAELTQLKNSRPAAQLRFFTHGYQFCVEVRNTGAQGNFRLMLETEGMRPNLTRVNALWQPGQNAAPHFIGRNMTGWAELGHIEDDRRTNYDEEGDQVEARWGWQINYERPPYHWWFAGSVPTNDPGGEWFVLRVLVTSDPPLDNDAVVKRLRFVDKRVIDLDSSETFNLNALVRRDGDDEPPF